MNRLFRWGMLIALLILVGSAFMALRIVFVDDGDVEVPSLIGISAVQATNGLQGIGLVARIDMVESDQPEGTVISQNPRAGDRVGKGKMIVVRVSKGGVMMRVPDVRGMDFADAVKVLDQAGFKTGTVIRVNDSLKPSGTVIAQNPAAPSLVQGDRMIELLLSEGSAGRTETVQVPDLRGQTERLARQILEQSSLSVSRAITVESNQVPEGTVLRTQPIAGSRVPHGNAIILYLAKALPEGGTTDPINISETPPNAPRPSETQAGAPPAPPAQTSAQKPGDPRTDLPQPKPASTAQPPQKPDAPQQVQAPTVTAPQVTTPSTPAPVLPSVPAPTPAKTAKIRYQVPPLSRPLQFKVTIDDDLGTRVLRDQQARGGEYLTMDIGYTGSATVTVQLDGSTVWQEKYR